MKYLPKYKKGNILEFVCSKNNWGIDKCKPGDKYLIIDYHLEDHTGHIGWYTSVFYQYHVINMKNIKTTRKIEYLAEGFFDNCCKIIKKKCILFGFNKLEIL